MNKQLKIVFAFLLTSCLFSGKLQGMERYWAQKGIDAATIYGAAQVGFVAGARTVAVLIPWVYDTCVYQTPFDGTIVCEVSGQATAINAIAAGGGICALAGGATSIYALQTGCCGRLIDRVVQRIVGLIHRRRAR